MKPEKSYQHLKLVFQDKEGPKEDRMDRLLEVAPSLLDHSLPNISVQLMRAECPKCHRTADPDVSAGYQPTIKEVKQLIDVLQEYVK